jgi:AcrR family transcriptional regulator
MNPKELREQAIKDAKCAVILDAARQVFKEKGYWSARVEDIAAAAGFSKPSLYNYYPDKESIILSLAIREFQKLSDKISAAAVDSDSFVDSIEAIFRIIVSNFREHFTLIMDTNDYQRIVSLHANMNKNSDLSGRFKSVLMSILDSFKSLIDRGKASGEIRSTVPTELLAQFMASLMQSVQMGWKMKGAVGDIDGTVYHLVDFLTQGLSIKMSPDKKAFPDRRHGRQPRAGFADVHQHSITRG